MQKLGVSDTRLVPNGIDLEAIRGVNPSEREVDVLYVGRLIKEKNANLVVRAIAELREGDPDVECVLVGDRPEHSTLTLLVDRFDIGKNVSFAGRLERHEDVMGLTKSAEVPALP